MRESARSVEAQFLPRRSWGESLIPRISCEWHDSRADFSALRLCIDVVGIRRRPQTSGSRRPEHVLPPPSSSRRPVWRVSHLRAVVVLQSAVNVIRIRIIAGDMVELRNWQVHLVLPARAAKSSLRHRPPSSPAITSVGILGINPDIMEITVRPARNHVERLACRRCCTAE